MEGLLVVRSVWFTGEAFLEAVVQTDPLRFFHPVPEGTELPPSASVGALVSVVIALEDREAEFHLHARVIDRRMGSEKRGLTVECVIEETQRGELVLMVAKGESVPYRKRRHRRLRCRLPCVLESRLGVEAGVADNINEGGLFVMVEQAALPDSGEEVVVRVDVTAENRWELCGRVVAIAETGIERGVGIEFLFRSSDERDETLADIAELRGRPGAEPIPGAD